MPKTACVEIYDFSELSDKAKEEARRWYRENSLDYEWWDCIYDDTVQIAELLGIEIKTRLVKLPNNKSYQTPCIFFSGFWSQGDGACYEGTYRYAKGSVAAVKDHAPKDYELHKIAQGLCDIQKEHFYGLEAKISHSGYYYHEYCMNIGVEPNEDRCHFIKAGAEDSLIDLLRQFAKWIYRRLEKEYDWLSSDEAIDDALYDNDYDFYEDGAPASHRLLRCA